MPRGEDDGLLDGLKFDVGDYVGTYELAIRWNLHREYVTDYLTKQPGFPKPVLNISRKTRRWRWGDCEEWRRDALKARRGKKLQ